DEAAASASRSPAGIAPVTGASPASMNVTMPCAVTVVICAHGGMRHSAGFTVSRNETNTVGGGPASGGPASGSPASGGPASGGPASGSPASGSPASGSPASGSPASGSPASGSPASTSPASGSGA